jgi:hypothetical protein
MILFSSFSLAIRPFISQSALNVVRHPSAAGGPPFNPQSGATSGNKMPRFG